MRPLTVNLLFFNWIKNEMIFYCISELILATIKMISLNCTGCQMPHFMTVLILYINLLNLSWITKCLFLRNMMPLR